MANCDIDASVRKCCTILNNAHSDVDKIAALLITVKEVQSEDCDSKSKAFLFHAIGADFLKRMLLGHLRITEGDGFDYGDEGGAQGDDFKELYRSTALSIITGFCSDSELARNKDMVKLLPNVFEVVEDSDVDEQILDNAIEYLKCIIMYKEGQHAILSHEALPRLVSLYMRLKSDKVIDILVSLAQTPGVEGLWDNEVVSFNRLMAAVSTDFVRDHSSRKFKLCNSLRFLLYSFNKDLTSRDLMHQEWPKKILKGLADILMSRIDDQQRDPALKLASIMVEYFGISWAAITGPNNVRQFQLLLVHLSSIEVRMQMEDQPLSNILKNAELIISCFSLLEVAISTFLTDLDEMREKDQVVEAFSNASAAVVDVIKSVGSDFSCETNSKEETLFVYAMIRFLCLGLTHEGVILNDAVYEIVPFVMKIAKDSFDAYRIWFEKTVNFEDERTSTDYVQPVDLMVVVLPSLRHFAVEDMGRKLILVYMDMFMDCLNFHWSVIVREKHSAQKSLPPCEEKPSGKCKKSIKNETHPTKHKFRRGSKYIMVCIFEVLTDTIILQPEAVGSNTAFAQLFTFIQQILPDVQRLNMKPLHAFVVILGLLLIKNHPTELEKDDQRVVPIVKSSVSFLKPYFKVRLFDEASLLMNSGENLKFWINIKELWYLGTITLGSLFRTIPWLKVHVEGELGRELMDYIQTYDPADYVPLLTQ